jgi:anti-sigma B factor antagonist
LEEYVMLQDITVVDNKVLAILSGSIYLEEAAQLREDLLEYIESGHATFLIDLEGVDYIDSSGLGTLVALQKRALRQGGSIQIKGLNGLVKELFELTRLNKVFDIQ